ncbi:MAG: GEVED domain-containing protein [Flavobacteriales bacterium]
MRVYTGSCGSLTQIGFSDDACGLQSEVTWTANAGVTYYILVRTFGSGTTPGAFTMNLTCLDQCSGVPSVGVLDGPATACSTIPFTLSVANPLVGYAYQWQRVTSAGWTNIAGATSSSYTATQTATTTYRCRVYCTLTSNYLGISAPKTVGMSDPSTCYCTPEYSIGTTGDDYIDAVSFGGINNVTGAETNAPFYNNYAPALGTTTSLARGGEYSGSIDAFSAFGGVYTSVWIDYNRNGIFETSERVFNSTSIGGSVTSTNVPFNLIVPSNASLGTTRMRVRLTWNNSNQDACATYGYGETEDYTVTIVAGSANDAQANASAINPAPYPACVNYTANLANATPSTGGGNDVWYQFVASSNAARIAVTSSFDVSIEVWDSSDTPVDAVEDATTAGNETFITGGLTVGETYYVLVRDESGSPSSCNVCIQALNPSTCDNGPNFASLCNTFKADWTGTAAYNFTFENQSTLAISTGSTTTTTHILLASVPGLEYGASYNVTVDAVYNLTNAAGVAEQVIATSTSPCPITIAPAPAVNLRAIDRDPATRTIGAFIGTDVSVCAVVSWDWSFELVDDFGNPLTLDPPTVVNTGSVSRYFRTSNIPGVAPGNRYRVMIRPNFAYGVGSFDEASFYYLRIAGGAGMVENGGNDATPNNFVVGEGSGASAAIYPNPSNGEMVNLNLAGINSDNVMVRIMDASGRLVWSNRYVVDGSLNTIVSFDRPLASGLYIVEMNFDGQVLTERMMVQK